MKYQDISLSKKAGIATIILNRPQVLNALRPNTYDELTHAMSDAAEDDEIGVVVVTGAGDRAFSSGGDIREHVSRTPSAARVHMRRLLKLAMIMRNMGKPIIAAVRGYCVGSGHELQLLCDITIASQNAKLGQTGPRVGSVPIWGATQLLPRIVGEKKAREIVYFCRQYTACEAEAMGLVNKVVPDEQLEEEVDRWCQELLDKSPQSLRIAKLALNFESDVSFYASFSAAGEIMAMITGSEENIEGMTAFLSKRRVDFRRFREASEKRPKF